ncbi:MAG: SsrA-binding protein SmpB [Fidelibacterota bacterium]
MDVKIVARNRKAYHEYHILEKYEAGIELSGSEVKSIREGRASLKEGFIQVRKGQVWLIGMHISPYSHTGYSGHEPIRDRRLLLRKREIMKLNQFITQKGLTAIPLQLYFNLRGWAKVEIGVARGKKFYDKREAIKARDLERDKNRELRKKG